MKVAWKKRYHAVDAFIDRHRMLLGGFLVVAAVVAFWWQGSNISNLEHANSSRIADIQASRRAGKRTVYCAFNTVIDYLHVYTTATPKQTAAEVKILNRVFAGHPTVIVKGKRITLSSKQITLLRDLVSAEVTLQQVAPQTANLNPFTLGDLTPPGAPCPKHRFNAAPPAK